MLGAANSPLEFMMSFKKKRGEQLAPCPFTDCTCSKASWEHVMWDCRFRPMDRQERHRVALTQEKDENLMHSMAQTVELMWNVRTASAEAYN